MKKWKKERGEKQIQREWDKWQGWEISWKTILPLTASHHPQDIMTHAASTQLHSMQTHTTQTQ